MFSWFFFIYEENVSLFNLEVIDPDFIGDKLRVIPPLLGVLRYTDRL